MGKHISIQFPIVIAFVELKKCADYKKYAIMEIIASIGYHNGKYTVTNIAGD